jgi:phosphatidylserine decarboxylase
MVYVPGKFLNADLDKASEDNERQHFLIEGEGGVQLAFTQIAGLVARRILTFVTKGIRVAAGERIGMIRFGSRVDVYLPAGTGPQRAARPARDRRRDGARRNRSRAGPHGQQSVTEWR